MFTKRERLHWTTRLSLLCAIAILSTCQDSVREVFHHARNFYLSGEYGGAARAMESFVHAHPGHELGSRALLIQGKAEIGRHDWSAARATCERLIATYPSSLEADKARYKLAELAELTGETRDAQTRYERIAASRSVMRAEASARAWLLKGGGYRRHQNLSHSGSQ